MSIKETIAFVRQFTLREIIEDTINYLYEKLTKRG